MSALGDFIVDVDYSSISTSHYFEHVFRISAPQALRHFRINIALVAWLEGFGTVTVDGRHNVIRTFVFNIQINVFTSAHIQIVGRIKPSIIADIAAVNHCANRRCLLSSRSVFRSVVIFHLC